MGTETVLPSAPLRVTASPAKVISSAWMDLPDCSNVQVRISAAAKAVAKNSNPIALSSVFMLAEARSANCNPSSA